MDKVWGIFAKVNGNMIEEMVWVEQKDWQEFLDEGWIQGGDPVGYPGDEWEKSKEQNDEL